MIRKLIKLSKLYIFKILFSLILPISINNDSTTFCKIPRMKPYFSTICVFKMVITSFRKYKAILHFHCVSINYTSMIIVFTTLICSTNESISIACQINNTAIVINRTINLESLIILSSNI